MALGSVVTVGCLELSLVNASCCCAFMEIAAKKIIKAAMMLRASVTEAWRVIFDTMQGISESPGHEDCCSCVLERLRDIDCNKRFILSEEDNAPPERGFHDALLRG